MSKRNSDYVVTEHRDLQVGQESDDSLLEIIIERFFFLLSRGKKKMRVCLCVDFLFRYT